MGWTFSDIDRLTLDDVNLLFTQFRHHPPTHELAYAIYVGMGGKPAPSPIDDLSEEENTRLAEEMLKGVHLPNWLLKQIGPNLEGVDPVLTGRVRPAHVITNT